MNGKFRLPSPAIVVACVALLAALSGTAFAQLGESAPIGSTTVRLAGGEINLTSEGMFPVGLPRGRAGDQGGWQQHASGANKLVFSLDNGPTEDLKAWHVYLINVGDEVERVDVFAVCAR
jgi:hypothetical protein